MICQNCKNNLQGDFKFCPNCGAPATQKPFCPGCGKEADASWQACPYCGCKFNGLSPVAPPQRTIYEPKHGSYHGSSSGGIFGSRSGNHRRRKGFLGSLFSTSDSKIRDYRIDELLGRGSFGAVARASKENGNYAIKGFAPEREENKFSLESIILAQLNHPRIPRFIEAFSHNGVNYLVQEFIEGYPLSYHIVNGKRFSEEEAKRILFQILGILDYLHKPEGNRLPVIHRDLRLSNLFWHMDKVYLVDFGLAGYFRGKSENLSNKSMENRVRPGGACAEVEAYALLRKEMSPCSDLFGVGVVGLDLFTNWIEDETLFQQPWQDILPASDAFKTFIERLLNPEKQFTSAGCAMKYFDE